MSRRGRVERPSFYERFFFRVAETNRPVADADPGAADDEISSPTTAPAHRLQLPTHTLTADGRPASILYGNIQALCSQRVKHKVQLLEERAETENVFLMAFTESQLRSDIVLAEIAMRNFQV